MDFRFDHMNVNVTDLERSKAFYAEALGLTPLRTVEGPEGRFRLVYLTDEQSGFKLELTCLRDHPQAYQLGENETHLCLSVARFDEAHARHERMGCICFENPEMGIYFIHDPDDYWIEIVPRKA